MSLDVSEIVIQTLEEEVASLKTRGATFAKEISEHKGAQEVCAAMAESVLGYSDLIERRLQKELAEEKITGEEAQIVRRYAKNLIVRLHNVCKSNEESNFNEGFVVRGKMAEAVAQVDILTKKINNRKALAIGQKERAEAREATETKFDSSDIETPVIVEGASLPKPVVEDAVPEHVSDEPPKEEDTKPSATKTKAADLRKRKDHPEVAVDEPAKEDKPTPQEKPSRRNIHKNRGKKS